MSGGGVLALRPDIYDIRMFYNHCSDITPVLPLKGQVTIYSFDSEKTSMVVVVVGGLQLCLFPVFMR